MSFNYLEISYGPCQSFHTITHRPQKLYGLRLSLQKLGFRIVFVPIPMVEYCAIAMCGYQVFHCNIKNLSFNLPEERDPVCQRAVCAVLDAKEKMERARHYLWTQNLILTQMSTRYRYGPKNYWLEEMELEPITTTCADCCHIFFTGTPDNPITADDINNDRTLQEIVRVCMRRCCKDQFEGLRFTSNLIRRYFYLLIFMAKMINSIKSSRSSRLMLRTTN